MQFRLWHLLAMMGAIPIACGALVYATPWSAAAVFTLAIVLLLAAVLLSLIANGPWRSFWIGFAVFGVGYWIILQIAPLSDVPANRPTWNLQYDAPPLITSKILDWIYFGVLPFVHEQPVVDGFGKVTNGSRYPRGDHFSRVGHSLIDLLFAMLGGTLGAVSHKRFRLPTPSRCE